MAYDDNSTRSRPLPCADADHRDDRFRRLLDQSDWDSLPDRVRERFSAKPTQGRSVLYRGRTTRLMMNDAGRVLAQAARLIGAPLPIGDNLLGRDAIVAVSDAPAAGGQVWTRLYARPSGFPQAIHSTKKFAGPTGLEEHVIDGQHFGLGMTLTLSARGGALLFTSRDYFIRLFRLRFNLPRMLSPGVMTIRHLDIGRGRFLFALTLRHAAFGLMIDQETVFEDMEVRHD